MTFEISGSNQFPNSMFVPEIGEEGVWGIPITGSIETLADRTVYNKNKVEELTVVVDKNTSNIADISAAIENISAGEYDADIAALSAAIDVNSSNISVNASNISTNSADISNLSAAIDALSGAGNYDAEISALSAAIDVNSSDISTNSSDITDLNTDVDALSAAIDALSGSGNYDIEITALSAAIDVNSADIQVLSSAIDNIDVGGGGVTGDFVSISGDTMFGPLFIEKTDVLPLPGNPEVTTTIGLTTNGGYGQIGMSGQNYTSTYGQGPDHQHYFTTSSTVDGGGAIGIRNDAGELLLDSKGRGAFVFRNYSNSGSGSGNPRSGVEIWEVGNSGSVSDLPVFRIRTDNAVASKDASLGFTSSSEDWTIGIDESESHSFKISNGGGLGSSTDITVQTDGTFSVAQLGDAGDEIVIVAADGTLQNSGIDINSISTSGGGGSSVELSASSIFELQDVSGGPATDGQILSWSESLSAFVPSDFTAGGDFGASVTTFSTSADSLQVSGGVDVSVNGATVQTVFNIPSGGVEVLGGAISSSLLSNVKITVDGAVIVDGTTTGTKANDEGGDDFSVVHIPPIRAQESCLIEVKNLSIITRDVGWSILYRDLTPEATKSSSGVTFNISSFTGPGVGSATNVPYGSTAFTQGDNITVASGIGGRAEITVANTGYYSLSENLFTDSISVTGGTRLVFRMLDASDDTSIGGVVHSAVGTSIKRQYPIFDMNVYIEGGTTFYMEIENVDFANHNWDGGAISLVEL